MHIFIFFLFKLCFKLNIIIYPSDFQGLIRFIRSYVPNFQEIDPYNYLVCVREGNFIQHAGKQKK